MASWYVYEHANATYSRILGLHRKLTKHCEEMENRLSQLETEASNAKKLVEDKDEQLKISYSIARQAEAVGLGSSEKS